MSVYTKSGDHGETSLIQGKRVTKGNQVFDALGTLDEFNSILGVVLATVSFSAEAKEFLIKIQKNLFQIGAKIASSSLKVEDFNWLKSSTSTLEELIDELESTLPKLTNFIIPGGGIGASYVHLSRSICRRLERTLVKLDNKNLEHVLAYTNRLSDFLFVLARHLNYTNKVKEVVWNGKNE